MSASLAGAVAAVAVSGCGLGVTSNPAPSNNENIITNPAPADLGAGDAATDVGNAPDTGGDVGEDTGVFCNPVCPDLGSPDGGTGDAGDMTDTADMGSSVIGDGGSD